MRRKVIIHGPSSMTVSLPSTWVKQHNIQKGGELDVYEEDEGLIIKPVCSNNSVKSTEVSLIGLDDHTKRDLLISLHKKGYDEIKINFDKQNMVKELYAFLNNMQLGFEIIKQDQESITIRNISNPESEQFDNLFRRIFRITIEYLKKIEAIINNTEDMTHSCLLYETSIMRISNYCKRIIIKDKRQNACFLYAIINDLNHVAHNLTLLLDEIKEMNGTPSKQFCAKFSEVCELTISIYNLFYKFSMQEYSSINERSKTLKKQLSETKSKEFHWDHLESIQKHIDSLLESMLSVQV